MRCKRCLVMPYCSHECLAADWKRHKHAECTPVGSEAAAASASSSGASSSGGGASSSNNKKKGKGKKR